MPTHPADLATAFDRWRTILGAADVLDADAASRAYGADTSTFRRAIAGALRVRSRDAVADIVRVAHDTRTPIYPVSRGNNWGYGTGNPSAPDTVVLDLSALDRILAFDADTGCVTVEPGVSQRQLAEYLERHGHDFMVPVTGAGPDGSILGNALERGYGITPHCDHFGAVRSLRAALPNGGEYVGALDAMGVEAAASFKWGVGPYLDGLFCQGAFGVVTQMTVALARRPEALTAFFFWIDRDEGLEGGVEAVREILRSVGGNVGGINLMNSVRLLAMERAYPFDAVSNGAALSREQLGARAKEIGVSAWMGAGAIYGRREVNRAVRAVIKRILRPYTNRIVFFDRTTVARTDRIASLLPLRMLPKARATLQRMGAGLRLLDGHPSRMALPLAYWKRNAPKVEGDAQNPARDGCGLLWYSPLVPMKPARIREFVTMAYEQMAEHRFEPLVTLTSLSDAVFDSTMPILFEGRGAEETARAEACYRALFAAGKRRGFAPYRVPVQFMDLVVDPSATSWDVVARIKRALDPHDVLAPGRYSPRGDRGA